MAEKLYAKKECQSLLLKYLGESPRLKIIDFFLDNPLSEFTKNEVIRALGMNKRAFFKYWRELEKSGVVKVTKRVRRTTTYQFNCYIGIRLNKTFHLA